MQYEVISTGSKGNAVVINKNILIDCGVTWKALSGVYQDLQLVLLTHWHGDHFNRSTIKRLAKERPTLCFGCRDYLVSRLIECGVLLRNIDVYPESRPSLYSASLAIEAIPVPHDVENTAYRIIINDKRIFYCTDTNDVSHIDAKGYDYYFLEANYSEGEIVERIKSKQENGEYCHEWDVLKNHLSKEKAEDWLYRNMEQHSQYVLLHEHKAS